MKTLSILIPVFNEGKTILEIIDLVEKVSLPNIKKEIIVIDDRSTDETLSLLNKKTGITLITQERNYGKGFAIRTGINQVTGDIVLIQDADLEYDPNDYAALIKPLLSNEADVVYGSRRLNKLNKKHSGLQYYIGGVGLTLLTNLLFPRANLTDEPTCYKVFRSSVLKRIKLQTSGFEFCPEITAKVLRQKIKIHFLLESIEE